MPALTPDAWAQIRHDYEHTTRPVEDICLEHGISSNTLRDRMRRWGWARRRPPVPSAGPAAVVPRIEATPLARFTSPHSPSKTGVNALMWGEVGSQSDPGEGLQTLDNPRAPHPTPLPTGEREQTAIGVGMAASNTRDDTEPSPHIAPANDQAANDIPIGQRLQGAVARVLPAIEAALGTLAAGPMRPRDMEQAARALGALMRTLRELNGLLDRHAAPEPERGIEEVRAELTRRIEGLIAAEQAEAPRRYLAAWEETATETNDAAR
jgi:hypothetical protein